MKSSQQSMSKMKEIIRVFITFNLILDVSSFLQTARSSSSLQTEWISLISSQFCNDRVKTTSSLYNSLDELSSQINEDIESISQCYYKLGDKWKQRRRLKDLEVGQMLIGQKISNADLPSAKNGPKVFFECGVGRIDSKGKWHMVSGMMRVGKRFAKPSVVKKKIKQVTGKRVELYVSKIILDEGKLEVCRTLEDVEKQQQKLKPVPVSSLEEGQEVVAKVVDVRPYGCMVDVGANRNGLLHIQKVADLYGKYIAKETGLMEAGLERGAEIKLVVQSIEKKKLFLDFTQYTKDLALEEQMAAKEEAQSTSDNAPDTAAESKSDLNEKDQNYDVSDDEASAWAAYSEEEDDYYFDDGEKDDDRDIEDALGIGSY
mmetsp:Transcript_27386/g.31317  ORF Transcript_27386/g.31317 Transcript_27386/m.31317 type:complete len:373 (-) Transcript_27386:354-1472(-)